MLQFLGQNLAQDRAVALVHGRRKMECLGRHLVLAALAHATNKVDDGETHGVMLQSKGGALSVCSAQRFFILPK